jgi:hypothetical protein
MYLELVIYVMRQPYDDLFKKLSNTEPELYDWVNIQRQLHAEGQLSTVKVDLLNKINFTWKKRKGRTNIAEKMIPRLIEFQRRNRRWLPTSSEDEDLIRWLRNQYTFYKRKTINHVVLSKLNEAGFYFDKVFSPYILLW